MEEITEAHCITLLKEADVEVTPQTVADLKKSLAAEKNGNPIKIHFL
jgi:hypothetical protein